MGWFSADMQTMKDPFLHSMHDIYYAEHQIEKVLPDMVAKASDAELKKGFQTHLKQTGARSNGSTRRSKNWGSSPKRPNARRSMASLTKRTRLRARSRTRWLNAALIAAAQAVEHYEITRYGTLVAWARLLGHSDVARVLNMNLKEEKATDKKLNGLAKRKINRRRRARQRKRSGKLERTQDALMERRRNSTV